MATLSGQAVHKLMISTDATTVNLRELKTDAIETLMVNRGKRSAERTRAGDEISREQRVKDCPSIIINLDPSTGASMFLEFAAMGSESDTAFDLQLRSGTARLRVTGIGLINDTPRGVAIVPVGSAWTFSDVMDAGPESST